MFTRFMVLIHIWIQLIKDPKLRLKSGSILGEEKLAFVIRFQSHPLMPCFSINSRIFGETFCRKAIENAWRVRSELWTLVSMEWLAKSASHETDFRKLFPSKLWVGESLLGVRSDVMIAAVDNWGFSIIYDNKLGLIRNAITELLVFKISVWIFSNENKWLFLQIWW